MEIGKSEKFDLAKIRVTSGRHRGELATRILNLEVGEGFVVDGIEQSNLSTRGRMISKEFKGARVFSTHRLALGKNRIVRVK